MSAYPPATREDRNYVSIGQWLIMMIVLAIPLVGQVMLFVWAFSGENETRKNYFKAALIMFAIFIVLGIGFFALGFGAAFLHNVQQQQQS